MTVPIATSAFRLADSEVLIGVAVTPAGPAPLFTDVDGEITCIAYTDAAEARADLPETHQLFSITVVELLRSLPAHVGLVIDPRTASPVYLPADGKQQVLDAGRPFPAGTPTAIGDPAEEPTELMMAASAAAPAVKPLRRLWRTWYQVKDTREKLLVVYDIDGVDGADAAAADLVVQAASQTGYGQPLLVLALDDVPTEHRQWLLAKTSPFYERAP